MKTAAVFALLSAVSAPAAGTPAATISPAEEVLVNGAVYTQDSAHPWAQAVAIAGGHYVAVGSSAEIRKLAGPSTRVTDLKGRMLMPGLIDDHVHAALGASGELYDCLFASSATPEQIQTALKACVGKAPVGAWIKGGYWDTNFFKHHPMRSPRQWLDEISGDRPMILRDDTGHNAWVNSAALHRANIDARTKDPVGGRFEREADGTTPNGIVYEAGAEKVQSAVSDLTPDQYRASIARVQQIAHRFGIIGVKEADASAAEISAYHDADAAGSLHLYVATCIMTLTMQDKPGTLLDFDAIDRVRAAYRSPHVDTSFVKIFLDGVPTPARTAAMIDPYLPDAAGAAVRGDFHVDPDVLARDIVTLDQRGYTVKMHAAGDRSIREGLDAIEAARRANPAGTLRHELAHAGFISPTDLPRFARLNAVAELSPVIWYPSPIIDAVIEAVGDRGRHYWPTRTLIAGGARLAAGSDWPSVVPSMDPWGGIEALVTRSDPYKDSTKTLWPEEAVSLADALRIYTLGGAAGLKRESETGSILVGKSADFIVLDRNLFKIPPRQISDVKVQMTYFQGRRVL